MVANSTETTDDLKLTIEDITFKEESTQPVQSLATRAKNFLWKYKKWILIAAVLAVVLGVSHRAFVAVLKVFFQWVQSIGWWGNILFILLFFVVSWPIILGGYLPLTMAAGSLYGVLKGTITVSIGSTLGGILVFFIFKKFAHKCINITTLKESSQFRLFKSLFNSSHNTLFVTLLARWAPLPYGLQNIFFVVCNISIECKRTNPHRQLAEVSFRDFLLVTWLGLLPLQLCYTYVGSTLRNLSKIASGETELESPQKISLVLQIAIAVALIAYFVYLTRKLQRTQVPNEETKSDIEINTVELDERIIEDEDAALETGK
jgi:uncharacterized membrane protein YdjX (TVP38/TMEM64 family)